MSDTKNAFALIGAGPMGLAMARNLQRLDIPFVGFDLNGSVHTPQQGYQKSHPAHQESTRKCVSAPNTHNVIPHFVFTMFRFYLM